jgi:hypothetical protein
MHKNDTKIKLTTSETEHFSLQNIDFDERNRVPHHLNYHYEFYEYRHDFLSSEIN